MFLLLMITISLVPVALGFSMIAIFGKNKFSIAALFFFICMSLWQFDITSLYMGQALPKATIDILFRVLRAGQIFAFPTFYYISYVVARTVYKKTPWWATKPFMYLFFLWSGCVYVVNVTHFGTVDLQLVSRHVSPRFFYPVFGPLGWMINLQFLLFFVGTFTNYFVALRLKQTYMRSYPILFTVAVTASYGLAMFNTCGITLLPGVIAGLALSIVLFTACTYLQAERIRFQAYYDHLTKLPNRYALKKHGENLLASAQRARGHESGWRIRQSASRDGVEGDSCAAEEGGYAVKFGDCAARQGSFTTMRGTGPFAVLLIDVDRFKNVNDTLGHAAGDHVLQVVTTRMRERLPSYVFLGRFGGEEFVAMAPRNNVEYACEAVLQSVAEPVPYGDGAEIFVTASIGVSVYPRDGSSFGELLQHADIAMYSAKELGGHCFRYYRDVPDPPIRNPFSMESKLRRALHRGELALVYQPQVSLHDGRVIGAEALLRWDNPELGAVSPETFIPIAEETGLIVPIGEWVLQTACCQNRQWQAMGIPPIKVGVNFSGRQLIDTGLVNAIPLMLEKVGLDARWLEIEITESMIMKNESTVTAMLRRFKDMGLKVSIDDFGTGYSSFKYIQQFPLDCLKIDRSFLAKFRTNSKEAAIIKAIVVLAHSLSLKVVAEGVETAEQLHFLEEVGCDVAQGYYFSPPVAAIDFPATYRALNEAAQARAAAGEAASAWTEAAAASAAEAGAASSMINPTFQTKARPSD